MDNYEVPYVEKENVSLVVVGFVGQEPEALRSTLEWFNYRVDTHWVGSKIELQKILKGEIPTRETIILCCHGDDDGILIDGEPTLTGEEIKSCCMITNKVIINLGCSTGKQHIADAFLHRRGLTYIAPVDDIEGNSSLLFAIHVFYYLANGDEWSEAVDKARQFDEECKLFKRFV
ncbi:hypothetical protein [Paenibacillus senegalensis]|uniref:hypothetical protein n=1 Tax=Paenibacillus senegalensis TaxID=1465766 RepID=UPI0002893E92|nr:hypothetical protein [Paenibacillus senegalensis]